MFAAAQKEANMAAGQKTNKQKKQRILSAVEVERGKSRGTCLSPPVLPKVWRRPFWMILESPSTVRSYKKREEDRRSERWEGFGFSAKRRRAPGRTFGAVMKDSHTCRPFIRLCISPHNLNTFIKVMHVFFHKRDHVTHRAGYVRAGRPLAVGPRRSRVPDFLLLSQQLAVLLLSVLHFNEQWDEAVLHLDTCKKTKTKFKKKNCLIVTTLPFAILIKIIINMPEIYFWMLQRKQTNKQNGVTESWQRQVRLKIKLPAVHRLVENCESCCYKTNRLSINCPFTLGLFTSKHYRAFLTGYYYFLPPFVIVEPERHCLAVDLKK